MARILIISSDVHEAAQRKTIEGLMAAGHAVQTASFKRGNMAAAPMDWPDIDLGSMSNGISMRRVLRLIVALWRLAWLGRVVRQADHLIARNLDMVVLALWARLWSGRAVPVVYQCLDVHQIMTGTGLRARLARWVERRALARSAALVVSAPGFLSHYFQAPQQFDGPVRLLENRILWANAAPARQVPSAAGPVTLGWVGTLRCPQSLALLAEVGRRCGPEVRIEFHGSVHRHQLPQFDTILSEVPALTWHGGYTYPQDLEQIYSRLTCVWGQDLWQAGVNSDWLLPNRLYEAGYFGCPVLALAGTETAAWVAAHGSGLVLPQAGADDLLAALAQKRKLSEIRQRTLALPAATFVQSPKQMAETLLGTGRISTSARPQPLLPVAT